MGNLYFQHPTILDLVPCNLISFRDTSSLEIYVSDNLAPMSVVLPDLGFELVSMTDTASGELITPEPICKTEAFTPLNVILPDLIVELASMAEDVTVALE